MDIKEIKSKDIHIFNLSADDNCLYIEYCGGYEYNYYNEIIIDLNDKTYTSNIKDINKEELAKIFNKLYSKLNFNNIYYRQYDIIELWKVIQSTTQQIIRLYLSINIYSCIYDLMDYINNYINDIGEMQIKKLAEEYNSLQKNEIDKIINHYYLLYLQYSYQLCEPSPLNIEHTTDINPLYDIFYSSLSNDKNNYNPENYILEKPAVDLIRQYLLFAQSFTFNITNDLKKLIEK